MIVAVVGVVAAAGLGLALFWDKIGGSTFGAKPREVEVRIVVRQSAASGGIALTAGGYIVPRHRVDVASKVSGRVEDVLFEKGDFVKRGQVLPRLNEAVAGSRPQEIGRARATVEQAEANLRTAEVNLERARKLNRSGFFAKQALDDTQNAYDVAVVQLKVARENYELARIGTRKEQIDLARAQLAESDAQIGLARLLS